MLRTVTGWLAHSRAVREARIAAPTPLPMGLLTLTCWRCGMRPADIRISATKTWLHPCKECIDAG